MRQVLITWAVVTAAVATGCSTTFRISKEGKGYIWGSNSKAIYAMLCESGDLKKILADAAALPPETRDNLYRFNCTSERSGAKVKDIYAAMTPEERKGLRQAFKRNGYDINAMTC